MELFNIKTRKLFLKRSVIKDIDISNMYIGSIINVYSRQLKIIDYADDYTRNSFKSENQKTFGMIKPDCVCKFGKIISMIE